MSCVDFVTNKPSLWHLWNLQETTGVRASEIMQISPWASRLLGLPDLWTALQFDSAVMVFGRHVTNRLNEVDRDGKPLYRLDRLLDMPKSRAEMVQQNRASLNMLRAMSGLWGGAGSEEETADVPNVPPS